MIILIFLNKILLSVLKILLNLDKLKMILFGNGKYLKLKSF